MKNIIIKKMTSPFNYKITFINSSPVFKSCRDTVSGINVMNAVLVL